MPWRSVSDFDTQQGSAAAKKVEKHWHMYYLLSQQLTLCICMSVCLSVKICSMNCSQVVKQVAEWLLQTTLAQKLSNALPMIQAPTAYVMTFPCHKITCSQRCHLVQNHCSQVHVATASSKRYCECCKLLVSIIVWIALTLERVIRNVFAVVLYIIVSYQTACLLCLSCTLSNRANDLQYYEPANQLHGQRSTYWSLKCVRFQNICKKLTSLQLCVRTM